jgi:hypothetical protein
MIGLERTPDRYTFAANQLKTIGIYPSTMPATDGSCASPEALGKGCAAHGSPRCGGKTGDGCAFSAEAAIADSHRRALEIAYSRPQQWTAIFEDDTIPVQIEGVNWDYEFNVAWKALPSNAKIVRLSWCVAPGLSGRVPQPAAGGSRFQWVQATSDAIGGCTAAYIVHKSIIPQLLAVFPCCSAVDCCYEWDYFHNQNGNSVLYNLVAIGGDQWIASHERPDWGTAHGVLMQAKNQLGSSRVR